MEPLTKLAPDKRAIYDKLTPAQQQKYWKVWQSKGPAYTHQMATLWAEGNKAARYEAGGLRNSRAMPTKNSVKDYLLRFLDSREGTFCTADVHKALKKAGSTHAYGTIKIAITDARAAGLIRHKEWKVKGHRRVAVYEVVGGAV